jgi:hypothetical protein
MKQVFMDVKTRAPLILDVPAPSCKKGVVYSIGYVKQ